MKTLLLLLLLNLVPMSRTSDRSLADIDATPARLLLCASLTVVPNESQYFEYDEFSMSCEHSGSDEWTVWRFTGTGKQMSPCGSTWGTQTSSTCAIDTLKQSDSGVYWCETQDKLNSNAVNVTVSSNRLILQSPVLPVTKGADVTLHCKMKFNPKNTADFYKNNVLIGSGQTDHVTIQNFSRSDQGAYKCKISGIGESPISWLSMDDDAELVSLRVKPDSSQMVEYENLFLDCGKNITYRGWTVKRFQTIGKILSRCGDQWGVPTSYGCMVDTIKQSDSGVYWCESTAGKRGNSINISIHGSDNPVILYSPIYPVLVGENVTLLCKTKNGSNYPAVFYKDDFPIANRSTGHMTISHVSKSDETFYKCRIDDVGESPSNWLWVSDVSSVASETTWLMWMLIRYTVVCSPYVASTLLMVSIYHQRSSEQTRPSPDEELDSQYDDVDTTGATAAAAATTVHHF